jgi:Predicted membrane protein
MHAKGKITSWNDERGFGFITPDTGGKQLFVHINALNNRNRRPDINQLVTYSLSIDKQGRPCAVKAVLAGVRSSQKTKRKNTSLSVIGAAIFLIIVSVSVLTGKIPLVVLAIYVVTSLLTFIMYVVDKSAARRGAWRTKENTLHVLSLAGGWPGALIAQQKLRHKSRKQSFRFAFWITILLNCGAFVWLFTPIGTATLQSLIARLV